MNWLLNMLNFDLRGKLFPYEIIPCDLSEFSSVFVDKFSNSQSRKLHFDRYLKYSTDLKILVDLPFLKQWVNGSFVTLKNNPDDIDFITFLDHSVVKSLDKNLERFRSSNSWLVYGVDAYIVEVYQPGSEQYYFTESDSSYWLDRFGKTRRTVKRGSNPKGFLEIYF